MTLDESPERSARRAFRPRSTDRRASNLLSPPPYQTACGLVLQDRRSPIDRRASWIKDFVLIHRDEDLH